MSVKLIVGNEEFDYPETGDINFGEEATGWAVAMTDIAAEVRNQGDIPSTETTLTGTTVGNIVSGDVPNLFFNGAFVQLVEIKGFIKRRYTVVDGRADEVAGFTIEGVLKNGSELLIDTRKVGDDVKVSFDSVGGQITFEYETEDGLQDVIIKYVAKTQIDESFFS